VVHYPPPGWRQHPRQHTRTHGRLSLDNLRRVKVHFLLREGGPAHGARQVQVWSTGVTLQGWAADLRAAGCTSVLAVDWKPGAPPPEHWPRARKRKASAAAGDAGGGGGGGGGRDREGVVRLFAFGKEAARRKVRGSVDWEPGLDWFVA
jgi:hypothetical protein